ncbi:hypothetical protein HQH89_24495 [Escherichia coli]|nr:hypothetical protein [Escherichia coli]
MLTHLVIKGRIHHTGVSATSATSCENCPVWQQSRPSI